MSWSPAVLHNGDELARSFALTLAVALTTWHTFGLAVGWVVRARPGWQRGTAWLRWCPPLSRRIAFGAAASAAIVLVPVTAGAASPAPPPTTTMPTTEMPFVRAPATAAPAAPALPPPSPPAPATPAPAAARRHVVAPGDNLWRIASAEVARVTGRTRPADSAIVPYWRALIEANRATLRSGDPSLIFPGEIVTLPDL
jgi:LysM domain